MLVSTKDHAQQSRLKLRALERALAALVANNIYVTYKSYYTTFLFFWELGGGNPKRLLLRQEIEDLKREKETAQDAHVNLCIYCLYNYFIILSLLALRVLPLQGVYNYTYNSTSA
jgi:hypothetical protein